MTSNARGSGRILGSLRSAEGKGVVRMEDRFDTDIDDLWSALTDPGRLARWIGDVEGDLRLGGEFRFRFFASGSEGTGRVDACEPPRRLLLTMALGQPDEDVIEVTLAAAAGSQVGRPLDGQAETLASGAGVSDLFCHLRCTGFHDRGAARDGRRSSCDRWQDCECRNSDWGWPIGGSWHGDHILRGVTP
jgi:uncharacterized protein YndB with AHSA1/START domain